MLFRDTDRLFYMKSATQMKEQTLNNKQRLTHNFVNHCLNFCNFFEIVFIILHFLPRRLYFSVENLKWNSKM